MNEISILLSAAPWAIWAIKDLTGLVAATLILGTPILWMALDYRRKVNETNKRMQIILTAIEKNPGALPEELISSLNKPRTSIKERLLGKLMRGIICIIVGLGTIALTIVQYCKYGESFEAGGVMLGTGIVVLAVGVAFLTYYFIGRRWLRSEIDAESPKKKCDIGE